MTSQLKYTWKRFINDSLLLLPPILAFVFFARHLDFIQDDSYISYRYVANFLNGDGLVFNIGERVEGFTNFGWVVYLILWGAFHFNYIFISKLTGIVFGAGLIVVTFLTARRLFPSEDRWFSFLPPYLLGFNVALAYWSQSGLETAAFAFFVALSVYLFLLRSRWLIFALILGVWIRPEGALVAVQLIIAEAIVEKRFPKFSFSCASFAFVLSLPFVLFKYFYYGSVLPNPFYAKTGMTVDQVLAGIDYAALFFKHYGLFGAGILVTAIFWKKLSSSTLSLVVMTTFYIAYIVLIGGDVLKVHRFFLPIFGLSAILVSGSIRLIVQKLSQKNRIFVLFLVSIPLLSLTYLIPKDFIDFYHGREQSLIKSMQLVAQDIKSTDSTEFTAAATTIGVFSYELVGHTVVDMLGLTDTMIARHPEQPIKEFESTWRERNFNATYVLRREPDYILFSTGIKPSAPAEQALLLYPQFLESYVSFGWFHESNAFSSGGIALPAFKKVHPLKGEIKPTYPAQYVNLFKKGCELATAGDNQAALNVFNEALAISPKPYYSDLLLQKAICHIAFQHHDSAIASLNSILEQDSLVVDAHKYLYIYAIVYGDSLSADIHQKWIQKLTPWYWPRLEFEARRAANTAQLHE